MKRTRNYYLEEYVNKERSFQDIAEEHGTYPNKIRREVIACRIEPRNKSDAQSAALRSGRHGHPTRGKVRPDEVKQRISRTLSEKWDSYTEEEMEDRSAKGRKVWESLSEDKKREISDNARLGLSNSRKNGSKLENFINAILLEDGFIPRLHVAIEEKGYKYDIILESEKVILDVCGPTHYMPIFGEEPLERKQFIDGLKADYAIDKGYVFVRIVSMSASPSELDKDTLKRIILGKLKSFAEKFPPENERLIHLEIV